jgi:4-amino-4-deoxy-L-arabinose transferase-like glycosyltransferase
MPRQFPDGNPADYPLDFYSGEAGTTFRFFWHWGLVVLAGVLFVLSAILAPTKTGFDKAVVLAILGVAALGFSFPWPWRIPKKQNVETAQPQTFALLRLVGFGLALYLGYRGQKCIAGEELYPGLFYFLAAAVALLAVFREPKRGVPDTLSEPALKWYWEALGLALVLLAGIWMRAYLLDRMPFGVECDEAGAGAEAYDIVLSKFNSFTIHPNGRPLFMLLPKVVAMAFLGTDNVGLRLMAVVFGVLGILALYLIARRFYGPRVALASAALLALSRWHVHFSRYGWSNTEMLVYIMVGFYMLVRGLATRRKWYFVGAGLILAFAIQTETAARVLPFILAGLLAYFLVAQRDFLKRNWRSVLAMLLGIWLGGAGMFMFWAKKPNYLFQRVYEVSVFSDDTNAPRTNLLKGLVESAKLSMTQLNWHGDYRPRHNGGMTGEPVADFWTAILFALGFGWTFFHWKRFRHYLPLMWFFGFMCASIFAIEAPQSHRAFGVVPAVFLIIGAFLDQTRRLFQETLGKIGTWSVGVAFVLLLIPIGSINYHKYFDTYPAFDQECTSAAKYMGRVWPQAEHLIMSAYLWMGHPPFKFYARDIKGNFYYNATQAVPYRKDPVQDVVYTTILEYPNVMPTLRWFYPQGIYHEEVHPKYGLQFKSLGLKKAEVAKVQGLNARYYSNLNWEGTPALERKDGNLFTTWDAKLWPLKGAGSVEWNGTLLIPHEGKYMFYLSATDGIEVKIGAHHLQASEGQETRVVLDLAGGLHAFQARARHSSPRGSLALSWSCPTGAPYYLYGDAAQDDFGQRPVPQNHFFTYAHPIGLLARYYASNNWSGKPAVSQVEPVVYAVWSGMPYGFSTALSGTWSGWLDIKQPGNYQLELAHSGYGAIQCDGKTIFSRGAPPPGYVEPALAKTPFWLTPGRHRLELHWVMERQAVLQLWWTPPGEKREIIPGWVLSPAEE